MLIDIKTFFLNITDVLGCGPNSYGADCKGVCSKRDDIMCRGMYMCTKYGCTCPPGLTGPLCNKGDISFIF